MFEKKIKLLAVTLFLFVYVPFLYEYGAVFTSFKAIDFPSFYSASQIVFNENRSPYTAGAFDPYAAKLEQRVDPYLYPPPSLLLFYPLSRLSYPKARLAMLAVNHVCVLLLIYLLLFKLVRFDEFTEVWRHIIKALAAAYIVLSFGVVANFIAGQINLVVTVLLCLTWLALKRNERAWLVAVPLSLAVALKTYPILFVALLLIRRRFDAAAWVGCLLLVLTATAYFVLPVALWSDWIANVLPTGGYGKVTFNLGSPAMPWNQSINGFTARLFLPNDFSQPLLANPLLGRATAYALSLGVVIATLLISVLCALRLAPEKAIDLQFALFSAMVFLVAPLSWEHHLVYVLPAAMLAFYLLLTSNISRFWQLLAVASLFLLAWRYPVAHPKLTRGFLTLAISIKLYAATGIWLFLINFALNKIRHRETGVLSVESNPKEVQASVRA